MIHHVPAKRLGMLGPANDPILGWSGDDINPRELGYPAFGGTMTTATKDGVRPIGYFVLLGACSVLFLLFWPAEGWAPGLIEQIRHAGPLGIAAFVIVYSILVVAMVPAALLTLAAGYIYGPIWGFVVVWPTGILGGSAAFLLGRTVMRKWARHRIERSSRLRRFDAAIAASGFWVICLLRLSPVAPFNLLNYVLGASGVRYRDFAASAIGSMPTTFLYVYVGSLVPNAIALVRGDRPNIGVWNWVMYGVGLVATIVVTLLVGRAARNALERKVGEAEESPSSGTKSARSDAMVASARRPEQGEHAGE